MTPTPSNADHPGRKDGEAIIRALANADHSGAVLALKALSRDELELAFLFAAEGVADLVRQAHVEELDLVLSVLTGVADLDPLEGPGQERRQAALDLTKRLIGRATAAITERRDLLAATKEG